MDCDSTRRCATRWRRRDIATRCSGLSPRIWSMFTGEGNGADGLAAAAGAASLLTTSSFSTLPPRPLPSICAVSRLLSAAIFFAAGMARGESALDAAAGFSAAFGAATVAAGAAAATPSAALPSVSMVAMISLLTTVPPSPLTILVRTPDSGAGSSSTTLSVSMSIRFSSRLTNSPCFLCQDNKVASATDSDSAGTFTSTNMCSPFSCSRAPFV